jgi:threonine dehydrogenase-like Zn-dependent dehydrogenase
MRAVTYRDVGDFRVADVPVPELQGSRDALVRISLGAICGSDLHIYHGNVPMDEGAVLGHEFVGVVEKVGSEVQSLRPGERVVAPFYAAGGPSASTRPPSATAPTSAGWEAARRSTSWCRTPTSTWPRSPTT